MPGKLFNQVTAAQKLLTRDQASIQKQARKIAGFLQGGLPWSNGC
ncbi:MAG: hypothetical protein ACKOCH_09570 [Bacteroidota bacterium]